MLEADLSVPSLCDVQLCVDQIQRSWLPSFSSALK